MTQTKISIQNLYYTYEDGIEALRDINLEIPANEISFFGPARSGKSTLLRLLNRLSDLDEGTSRQGYVLFDGQDVFDRAINVSVLRQRIGMVFAMPTPLSGSI